MTPELISAIASCITALGVIFAFLSWRKSNKLSHAKYLESLISTTRTNPDMRGCVYMMDYALPWYNSSFHGSGKLEQDVDNLMYHLSFILYLREEKIISENEFNRVSYDFEMVLKNFQTQDYLYNFRNYAISAKLDYPYESLVQYCDKNGWLADGFFDPTVYKSSKIFHKYLNWNENI